jgi:hypothetical protein
MLKPLVRMDFVRSTQLSYDKEARDGQDFFYLLQFFVQGGKAAICDAPYYFYTQPFGTVSRQWSHTTRKRYNFQLIYDINQSYLRGNAEILTPQQSQYLEARGRRLASLEKYFRAKELLGRREWRALLRRLVEHPAMLECVVHRLCGRYFTRFTTPAATRVAQQCRRRSAQGPAGMHDRSRPHLRDPAHNRSKQASR